VVGTLGAEREGGKRLSAMDAQQALSLPTPSFMAFSFTAFALSRPSRHSARSRYAVLNRCDELPIPTCPVRMRMSTDIYPLAILSLFRSTQTFTTPAQETLHGYELPYYLG